MSPAVKTTSKGEDTRAQILAAAVEQASAGGFESLTIGLLAERTGMSKSGLFAHFGSKLDLQIAALDEAARQFGEAVFIPALKAPRGLKRLRALFDHWISWTQRARLPGGCPVDAATREFGHQPGAMRDAALAWQKRLDVELAKAVGIAIDNGELAPTTDTGQFAFDMTGIVLAFYRSERLLGLAEAKRRAGAAFDRLVQQNRPRA
jgi:AcrR family transcriptional regulator